MSNVIPWEIEANRFDFPSAAYFDSGVNKCFVPRGDAGSSFILSSSWSLSLFPTYNFNNFYFVYTLTTRLNILAFVFNHTTLCYLCKHIKINRLYAHEYLNTEYQQKYICKLPPRVVLRTLSMISSIYARFTL